MTWYYVDAGQQAGPVTEEQLEALVRDGKVQPETLVWREGMDNWQPYSATRSAPGSPAPAPPPPMAAPAGTSGGEVVCAECNQIFPQDNAIQYGNVWVCAGCKPKFVQKLREGAALPGLAGVQYGGFWVRFVAKFIDGLILGVVLGIPMVIFVFRSIAANPPGAGQPPAIAQLGMQVIFQVVYYLAALAYNGFFLGKFAATPGKMAMGLKVVQPDGSPVSYLRAIGRTLAEILSGILCYIGYIIAAFDGEKRALHDHIANTRVIRTR